MTSPSSTSIVGCLLGTAVGDALGLPHEGLSPQRQRRLFPDPDRHQLVFGKGMVSDDTEHTCMVAQSLIVAEGNSHIFTRDLAGRLRWWLVLLPAGVGFATLRSIGKLWLGFSPHRSGVYSAGNGAAMRSAIIGVCYGDRPQLMVELVRCSTRMTHSDRKAEFGAIAVALAAYLSSTNISIDCHEYFDLLSKLIPSTATEFLDLIDLAIVSINANEATPEFAINMGWKRGISGYVYQTVPIAIHAWLSHQENYHDAILTVIKCGGDTDTTAAIVGGIIGARVGKIGIPTDWLTNLVEFPCNINYLEKLGSTLAVAMHQNKYPSERNTKQSPPSLPVYLVCLRNLFFLLVVIFHGFRRCFP